MFLQSSSDTGTGARMAGASMSLVWLYAPQMASKVDTALVHRRANLDVEATFWSRMAEWVPRTSWGVALVLHASATGTDDNSRGWRQSKASKVKTVRFSIAWRRFNCNVGAERGAIGTGRVLGGNTPGVRYTLFGCSRCCWGMGSFSGLPITAGTFTVRTVYDTTGGVVGGVDMLMGPGGRYVHNQVDWMP